MSRFFAINPNPPTPASTPHPRVEGFRELKGQNLATVHVVGGAHLSEESARLAAEFITSLKPHEVLLELCEQRRSMLDPKNDLPTPPLPPFTEFAVSNPWTVINPLFWVVQLPLLGFEALTDTPMGGEMRTALRAARGCGATVYLIDRPVSITLLRALGAAVDAVDTAVVADALTALPRAVAAAKFSSSSSSAPSSSPAPRARPYGSAVEAGGRAEGESSDGKSERDNGSSLSTASGLETPWGFYSGVVRAPSMPEAKFQELRREAQGHVAQMLKAVEGGHQDVLHSSSPVEVAAFRVIGAERDRLLAFECHKAAARAFVDHGEKAEVVAVVGAAHSEGMEKEWQRLTRHGANPESKRTSDGKHSAVSSSSKGSANGSAGTSLGVSTPGAVTEAEGEAEAAVRLERRLLPGGQVRTALAYSDTYLESIHALYDVEEARTKVTTFCAKALAADGALLLGTYASLKAAERRGGSVARTARFLRRAGTALGVGGAAATTVGLGLGYTSVRAIQERRVREHSAKSSKTL